MNFSILKNRISSPWLALILIALVAAVIYSNIYHCPFIFDDTPQIVEKAKIRDIGNYFSLEQLLKPRAIVDFTFAINYKFGKLNVFGYHLINVLIHIINGFIVYFLASIIFKQLSASPIPQFSIRLMSLFAALIFIAHPIQTQAVTYTIQRYASMAAMFYMASVLFYIKARIEAESIKLKAQRINDEGRRSILPPFSFELSALSYIFLSILCGMISVLCKLNTASLPGVILIAEYLLIDRTWQGWKKKIPWFSVAFSLWFFFVLYVCSGGEGLLEDVSALARETEAVSRWTYLCTQFNVIVIYIRLLFLPLGQNLDYFYQFKDGFWDGYTSLAFLFLMVIVGLGIWCRKKRPVIAFAIFWFFITLSVESSIIPISDALFEHRLYLPMFGFALFVPFLLFLFLHGKKSWLIFVSTLIVISLGAATYLRNQIWKEEITMWTDVVKKAPDNYKGWNNWGDVLVKMEKHTEAIPKFKKSLSIRPDNDEAWYNWGVALLSLNKPDEAIPKFKQAIAVKQDFAEVWCNWGCALLEMGRPDEAIEKTKIALSIKKDYAEAWYNWGIALMKTGKPELAIPKFKRAAAINPDDADAWYDWGVALGMTGSLNEAVNKLEKAVEIKPDYAEAWGNWGIVLLRAGRPDEAIKKLEKAVGIEPGYVKAWFNYGVALFKLKRLEKSLAAFEKVLVLAPDHARAKKITMVIKKAIASKHG